MSAELLSSKIIIVEEQPRVRALPALPTAVLGAVGVTERGPIAQATLVNSPEEFNTIFGGFTTTGEVALAADGYFLGGRQLWISRVVHFTDPNDPTTIATAARAEITLQDRAGVPLDTLKVEGKTEGTYANDIRIIIGPPTSGDANEFNLSIEDDGVIVEIFPNVTIAVGADNYVETVVNNNDTGSNLIRVTNLLSATVFPDSNPAEGTFGPLTGGDDGLTDLADADFIGGTGPNGATGIRALDQVQTVNLLIVPGQATSGIHNAMVTYCEVTRDKRCFPILDPPAGLSATEIVTYMETTASLLGLSEFGAIYWPRVKVVNPSPTVFGTGKNILVAPSGLIAGLYARVDAARPGGVYDPPAGIENGRLFGVVGLETGEALDEKKLDLVYPKRINPITTLPGAPFFIDGSRTLKGDGNFPFIAERRGVIFIEQTLKLGLLFAKHRNNTEKLRAQVERTGRSFLLTQMDDEAFRTRNPATAFFIDADIPGVSLNKPSVVFAGKLVVRIGLATNKPAEFIILRISQDTRALEEQIAA